jgi:hypothetical protein
MSRVGGREFVGRCSILVDVVVVVPFLSLDWLVACMLAERWDDTTLCWKGDRSISNPSIDVVCVCLFIGW